MSASAFLDLAINFALVVLIVSFLLTIFRIVRGPGLPDRILALDMLVTVGIGFIATIAIKTGFSVYLDVAIALGLVGFLATIALARFVIYRWESDEPNDEIDGPQTHRGQQTHGKASK